MLIDYISYVYLHVYPSGIITKALKKIDTFTITRVLQLVYKLYHSLKIKRDNFLINSTSFAEQLHRIF